MGIDISLHIEIRQRNQWHLMTVTSPQWEKTDHEYEIFKTEVFNCRYYHFGISWMKQILIEVATRTY